VVIFHLSKTDLTKNLRRITSMAILKKDLNALRKDFKALENKMEKLLKAFETSPKPKQAPKKKAVKAKVVKKVAAKKKATPKAPAKKAPAPKKAAQATATDQVLKIIKRSKKGVDVPTLKTKTGFNDKKVRNIIFRATKEGRIQKSGRGIYVGA
jgi:hypothetical protein